MNLNFDFFLRYHNNFNLSNKKACYLICGFPGSGNVGKIAIDYIIKENSPIHILDIYSSLFPPQIIVNEKGTCELVKNSLFFLDNQSKNDENNLILITGDVQPNINNFEYLWTKKIFELLESFNIKKVISLAAYVTGNFVDNPKIYGTCTNIKDLDILKKGEIELVANGFVSGMNGIIIGMGNLMGLDGICLLGETSGYILDGSSAYNVLSRLNKILNIKINLENMEEIIKETSFLMKNVQQQMLTNKSEEMKSKKEKEQRFSYIS